jgi:hypothetical protein
MLLLKRVVAASDRFVEKCRKDVAKHELYEYHTEIAKRARYLLSRGPPCFSHHSLPYRRTLSEIVGDVKYSIQRTVVNFYDNYLQPSKNPS